MRNLQRTTIAIAALATLSATVGLAADRPPAGPAPAHFKAASALANIQGQVTFLYYPDLAAPRAFYGKLLGLASYYDEEWVSLYRVASGATIGIVKSDSDPVTADAKRDAAMVSIVTSDVDGWFSRLKGAAGVVVQKEIYNHPVVPIRAFLLRDPGGYSVEFFQWLGQADTE